MTATATRHARPGLLDRMFRRPAPAAGAAREPGRHEAPVTMYGAPVAPELEHDYAPGTGWDGASGTGVPDLDDITLADKPLDVLHPPQDIPAPDPEEEAQRAGEPTETWTPEFAERADTPRPYAPANDWAARDEPEDTGGSWGPWDIPGGWPEPYAPDLCADLADLPAFREALDRRTRSRAGECLCGHPVHGQTWGERMVRAGIHLLASEGGAAA